MTILFKSLNNKRGLRRYIGPKRAILLLVLSLFIIWAWNYYTSGMLSPAMIEHYRDHHPAVAIFIFILIYAISVVAALPSLPLNLAAGFFWGGLIGGVYASMGVTLGSWISFMTARSLIGQPLADRFESGWVTKVQNEFERNGWKFIAFARINPVIPTGPLNYLLGLTALTNRDFLWATFVFLLPPSIAIAYIGDTLQSFTVQRSGVSDVVRGIFIVSAAITLLVVIRFTTSLCKNRSSDK